MVACDNNNPIVADFEIFNESYIPSNILARGNQIKEIRYCLSPAYKNGRPINAWLWGPPGSGKTMISNFILEKLKEESKIGGIYVNCWKSNSCYAVLDTMLNELRIGFGDERDSRLKLYKFETFVDNKPFIVILDEIDLLDQKERNLLLYMLLSVRKVGLICVSESREPVIDLEDRVKSRLNPKFIHFEPYTENELVEILKERALSALHAEGWDDEILRKIATLSDGNARTAVQIIKSAVQKAEESKSGAIRPEFVKNSINEMRDLRKEYSLKKLPDDLKMIYDIIKRQGTIISGKLWDDYLKQCTERELKPIARRTFTSYMEKLRNMNMIKIERARVKGKVYILSILD